MKLSKMKMSIQRSMTHLLAFVIVMVLPVIGYCQPPDPGDETPDVPFDDNMNLVFLLTGVTFAAIIVWQEIHKRNRLKGHNVK